MGGPRNNLTGLQVRTNSEEGPSSSSAGNSASQELKFRFKSPEKPNPPLPSFGPIRNTAQAGGRNTSSLLPKAIKLNQPNGSISSPVRKPSIPMKRFSPDASGLSSKRLRRDVPLGSTRFNLPDNVGPTPHNITSSPLPRMSVSLTKSSLMPPVSPSKSVPRSELSLRTPTKRYELDLLSMEKLLKLKSSRQEKTIKQAELLMERLRKHDEDDSDLDLLEAQYELLKKKVEEVHDIILRRSVVEASSHSGSSSPTSSTPVNPSQSFGRTLFTSPNKQNSTTTWTEFSPSPKRRIAMPNDPALSSATTSRTPNIFHSSSSGTNEKAADIDESTLWEGMEDLDHAYLSVHPISPKRQDHRSTYTKGNNRGEVTIPTSSTFMTTRVDSNASISGDVRHKEVHLALRDLFKKQKFRPNQLEAIMATLSGRDVFVLMPTGGGKSLCYQLPAVCVKGATKGVTMVISPLKALMEDQVAELNRLGIDAVILNSDTEKDDVMQTYTRLRGSGQKPALLYVAPEKLEGNVAMLSTLQSLYDRGELARFVVDECHVLSSWGRSFRDAYLDLHILRERFPGVPFMALTATATPTAVKNIVTRLKMREDYLLLRSSFNRPNLSYNVTFKPPTRKVATQHMVNWIREKHPDSTGIIYCLSRENCDDLARELREKHGLSALPYHAGLEKEEKRKALGEWQAGILHIIVATIAFGMGIDKPDVRFVIHRDLPKSLEGYYQETGRAGRDGEPSDCILYYAWKDVRRLDNIIERSVQEEQISVEECKRQKEEVRQVARYAMLDFDCRREHILRYFGETFHRDDCNQSCDACMSTQNGTIRDLKQEAREFARLVKELSSHRKVTRTTCINAYRGTKGGNALGHKSSPYYGRGSHLDHNTVERLVNHLLIENVVEEYSVQTDNKWFQEYIKVGSGSRSVLEGNGPFNMMIGAPRHKAGRNLSRGKKNKDAVALITEDSCFDEDDDLGRPIEEYSHTKRSVVAVAETSTSKKVTVMSTTTAVSATREVITVDEDEPVPKITCVNQLHERLLGFREELSKRYKKSPEDILSSECVETLALLVPKELVTFRRILDDIYRDTYQVQYIMDRYGMRLLNHCIEGAKAIGPSKSHMKAIKKMELKSKFSFEANADCQKGKRVIKGMDD